MNKKHLNLIVGSFAAILIVSVLSAYLTTKLLVDKSERRTQYGASHLPTTTYANFDQTGNPVDFTYAAEQTVHAVVHVKTSYKPSSRQDGSQQPSIWDFFFGNPNGYDQPYGQQPPIRRGSGSGVIITADGYIVTNNHVIDRASEVEVTLDNKQSYKAKVVGTDPSTDIAVLKIDARNLEYLPFGNSDNLKVGEWVLAVGNPFNLASTVTAGIVSAKGRNLGIIQGEMRIESFIQTDAAVNSGNSGGALVNMRGELMGINTAIASQTGNFAGYSFAIPASIAKKTVDDLIEYGVVQRALLGIQMVDLNSESAKELNIKTDSYKGVYIADVVDGSAAAAAGIAKGDIITQVNGTAVNSASEVQEQISRYRPNDQVQVTVLRGNNEKQFNVTLRNRAGNTEPVKSNDELTSSLGATFKELTDKQKKELGIPYGIQVVEMKKGKLLDAGVKTGYIIIRIDKMPIQSVDELKDAIQNAKGGTLIEGIYPNGQAAYYGLGL